MTKTSIEPFYFGQSETSLFGCYHAPEPGYPRPCGVVLCAPMGEESIRFHRAYRQLASRLSARGFAVLRFDYYGCGDSLGASDQGDIGQWQRDISAAIGELRRRSGVGTVCLMGLRLGATLATVVSATRTK